MNTKGSYGQPFTPAEVGQVQPGSAAEQGGVRPGDVIIADDDGVVCVPRAEAGQALAAAQARVAREEQNRKALADGQLGLDLYGLRAKLAALGVEWVSAEDEADTHG